MKSFVAVVLLAILAIASGQTCDPLKGANGFNPDCTNKKLAYCRNTDPTVIVNPPYECVECKSSCDCGMDKYCSSKPGQLGKCVSFKKEGKSCRALSTLQLQSPEFPDSWKCADTYTVSGSNATLVDQRGTCIKGKCHQCSYTGTNNGMSECGTDSGRGPQRECIYPGVLHDGRSSVWNSNEYYTNTIAVWNAVFFPFLMIIMGVQVAVLILTILRCRGGAGGSSGGNSIGMSSSSSSKHSTKAHDTADPKHSTITPSYDKPPSHNSTPPSYDEANSGSGSANNSRPGSTQIQYLKEEEPS